MFNYSNLTPDEIIKYAGDGIPPRLLKAFEQMQEQIAGLELDIAEYKRCQEIHEEQIYNAEALVKEMDNWAEDIPKKWKKGYDIIRDNTFFEI